VSTTNADLSTGLVAYYPFSGNVNDASGSGNNGTVFNATLTSDRFGNTNSAYSFNGTTAYIDVRDSTSLHLSSNFTLSAWIYQSAAQQSGYRIIDKALAGTPGGFALDTWGSGIGGHTLRLQGAGTNNPNVLGATAYSLLAWHHVAAVVSGSNGWVYLDGIVNGTGNVGSIPVNTLDLYIGHAHPNGGSGQWEWFNGKIDDVRIYNRALSATEIGQLYTLGASAPMITVQPQGQAVQAGTSVALTVTAVSALPLNYQWQFNGQSIPVATNTTLTLSSVTAANSGGYSLTVWNPVGSVTSTIAYLAVLTDGANGNQPAQIIAPICPAPQPSKDSLVLVTHGWSFFDSDISWITKMANTISSEVPPNWEIRTLDWTSESSNPDPEQARIQGGNIGSQYGLQLNQQPQWKQVHLIAHSAGAAVIEAIAEKLKQLQNPPVIQETFLDPYTGKFLEGRSEYGRHADWAENYFVFDYATDLAGVLYGIIDGPVQFADSTSGQLQWAYNVDVGGTIPAPTQLPVYYSGIAYSTPPVINVNASPSSSHGSPIDFYLSTVNGTAKSCAAGYGFPLSIEDNGAGNWAAKTRNNSPLPLCGMLCVSQNLQPVRSDSTINFSLVPNGTSSSGVIFLGNGGAGLSSVASGFSPQSQSSTIHSLDSSSSGPSNAPAWLAVGLTITTTVNFVQFDAGFTDTNTAQGLLTVYWNTNQIGIVDERVETPGSQTYRFALPGTVTNGLYTLSFRLDAFNITSSSITVTNVTTGFVGISTQPTLGISLTNNTPILQFAGASNYNYLVETSTNLVDWIPTALLVNTNGTVLFGDPEWTNYNARFYRVLLP
jgi:hypothetical protein